MLHHPPELPQPLRVGAPVAHELLAALQHALTDPGVVIEDGRVEIVGERAVDVVKELEEAPDADAVAMVAPGVVALRLRRAIGALSEPSPVPKAKHSRLLQKQMASRLLPGHA
jgi:hypothetical protein